MSSTTTTTTKMFNTKSAEVRDLQKDLRRDLGPAAAAHQPINNNIGDNVFFQVLSIKVLEMRQNENGNGNQTNILQPNTSAVGHQQQQPRGDEQVNVDFCQYIRSELLRRSVADSEELRKRIVQLL